MAYPQDLPHPFPQRLGTSRPSRSRCLAPGAVRVQASEPRSATHGVGACSHPPDRQMQIVRVEALSLGAMDRQAPRSVPPFSSSVRPKIWMDGTSSASAAGGSMAQSGSNVLVTCRSSVRRGRTAASPFCQLEVPTPMHSSQLCVGAPPSMAVRAVDGRTGAWCALHSYRVCKNLISSSPARKRLSLMSGASSRASAFSFISRLAST